MLPKHVAAAGFAVINVVYRRTESLQLREIHNEKLTFPCKAKTAAPQIDGVGVVRKFWSKH